MTTNTSGTPAGGAGGNWPQTLVGVGVTLTGIGLGIGARGISSDAGYGGVGPNFMPWLCAVVLTICGLWITWEARTGGFREMDPDAGPAEPANWSGLVWVTAGLLLNAALIVHLGFILSCALCYLLAVQGLRRSQGQALAGAIGTWIKDLVTGLVIAAPVFWMFTQFLAINLPGLTRSGWL
ncbi:tripartite tricarboxylate transporter TctB family protein [Xenophilus arseniciresistens]|uniref:Tripartite tricarboxylate transporter TctB family protein n=1 Tax=Xenophilus arseniciresistens TaxID=1283306 RepID=A0AAE3NA87_9BURK|nr:tripartite tricarboxylate transporter TctB family protein [Xenophilus arseniciresistens]MDA7417523.1 tripartite tricarboxylate transporter TctB family protein [Xenophilus arseniciresistens]